MGAEGAYEIRGGVGIPRAGKGGCARKNHKSKSKPRAAVSFFGSFLDKQKRTNLKTMKNKDKGSNKNQPIPLENILYILYHKKDCELNHNQSAWFLFASGIFICHNPKQCLTKSFSFFQRL